MNKQRFFKNWIIDAGFQFRFSFKIALAALVIGAINVLVFNKYMGENYELVIDPFLEAGLLPESAGQDLYLEFYRVRNILIATTVGFSFFCLLIGIVFSHSIIGPIIHFRRVCSKVSSGDTGVRVHLRRKDEFKYLAQDFNQMLDSIITEEKPNQAKAKEK